jgi:allophanate hydrolase
MMPLARAFPDRFQLGVPVPLDFKGPTSAWAFVQAVAALQALGSAPVPFDFHAFAGAGQLIFDRALVAERTSSYGDVMQRCPEQVVAPLSSILERGRRYTAFEAFRAQYRLGALQRQVRRQFESIDLLVTPTVQRPFRVDEMKAEPLRCNAEVGHYTYGEKQSVATGWTQPMRVVRRSGRDVT